MTIEEYLADVKNIYYQLSVIVKGKQLLIDGSVSRQTDILDDRGKLTKISFASLSLPASTKVGSLGSGHAVVNFGDARLVIWPT